MYSNDMWWYEAIISGQNWAGWGFQLIPPKISGFPNIISVVGRLFEVTSQMVALSHPGESPLWLKTFVTSGWFVLVIKTSGIHHDTSCDIAVGLLFSSPIRKFDFAQFLSRNWPHLPILLVTSSVLWVSTPTTSINQVPCKTTDF